MRFQFTPRAFEIKKKSSKNIFGITTLVFGFQKYFLRVEKFFCNFNSRREPLNSKNESLKNIFGISIHVFGFQKQERKGMPIAWLLRQKGVGLDALAQKVAEALKIDAAEIWKGGRSRQQYGGGAFCVIGPRLKGMAAEAVSKAVGITAAAAAHRGESLASERGLFLKE